MALKKQKPRYTILITSGPTREYIDSVRYISNPSSGKMGHALATAAARRGHNVVLVSGPVSIKRPNGVKVVSVETGKQMLAAAKDAFQSADAAIFAAAVCDYRPRKRETKKLPKNKNGATLELVATEDIAASLGRRKGERVTLAFALEDHDGRRKAEAKLAAKRADAIVLNSPATINAVDAKVEFIRKGGEWDKWQAATKSQIATRIIAELEDLIEEKRKIGK